MIRLVALLFLILIAPRAMAIGVFEVSGLDASMEYLGAVFGQMGTLPVGVEGSPLFANMLQIMNKIIFFLGIIIVVYTAGVSTIQTAQEGEVLGKKWSTIWIPVRGAFGLFLLLPSPGSGYSYIQMAVMYFIVQGVGAANAIWDRVLFHLARGQTIVSTSDASASVRSQTETLKAFLKAELCTYKINNTPELLDQLDGEEVTFFYIPGRKMMMWGLESSDTPICGELEIPSLRSAVPQGTAYGSLSVEPLNRIYRQTMETAAYTSAPMAEETYVEDNYENWTTPANLSLVVRAIKNGFLDIKTYYDSVRNNTTSLIDIASAQGWIHAGSYYYMLVSNAAGRAMDANYPISIQAPDLSRFGQSTANSMEVEFNRKIKDIFKQAQNLFGKKPTRTSMIGGNMPGGGGGFLAPISNALKQLAMEIISSMSGGTGFRDPLVPISKAGQTIMLVTEIVFWILIVVIPLLAIASIPPCINPVWGMIVTIAQMIIGLILVVFPLLWTSGVILGLYVPLIPWLVFTFSAIAWIILVIEAIVAAPLVALILIVPSEDEIGKAGHSIVILLGLVFRPALMVLGFILGAKMMFVAVSMLDYGFKEYIMSNLTGIGIFGAVAIIVIYMGVMVSVIHQCFGLIYQIPDKVLRWMGGQPETQDVMGKVQQIKGSAEKAGKATGGMMKGAAGAAQEGTTAARKGAVG